MSNEPAGITRPQETVGHANPWQLVCHPTVLKIPSLAAEDATKFGDVAAQPKAIYKFDDDHDQLATTQ